MIGIEDLPLVNACLNAAAGALLLFGYVSIRRGRVARHKTCMVAALLVSALFLVSYVVYHANTGTVRFTTTGWPRLVYFAILLTHTPLAALILPLALVTASRALRGRFDQHVRVARWTLPIWLYVSVTGILVYMMLYRWFPSSEIGP